MLPVKTANLGDERVLGIAGLVRNAVPEFAKPSKLLARNETKLKISYPTFVRNTNNASTN
jgi:hypothetical protein